MDYKESWLPKNWCFWTVVLEKTLESPLDSKEIQPVQPKGNQSWVFIGRTDAEAETPMLWPPDAKNWLLWKVKGCWEKLKVGGEGPDRGWDGWMASPIQWTWVWINSGSWRWTRRPGMLKSRGSQRVGHDWATELNWKCKCLNQNISNVALLTHCSNIHCINKFLLWKFYLLMWNEQNCSSNKWPLFSVHFIVRSAKIPTYLLALFYVLTLKQCFISDSELFTFLHCWFLCTLKWLPCS